MHQKFVKLLLWFESRFEASLDIAKNDQIDLSCQEFHNIKG